MKFISLLICVSFFSVACVEQPKNSKRGLASEKVDQRSSKKIAGALM